MQGHERYEELCALSAIAQISAEEAEELAEHLRGCDACKSVQGDFGVILDQLPRVIEIPPANSRGIVGKTRREQFMLRAHREGLRFSSPAAGGEQRNWWSRERRWFFYRLSFGAATGLVALFAIMGLSVRDRRKPANHQVSPVLKNAIAASQKDEERSTHPSSARDEPWQKQAAKLEQQVVKLKAELSQKDADLELTRQQIAGVSNTVAEQSGALEKAKSHLSEMNSEQNEMIATLVEKQTRIHELTEELGKRDLAVERERELNGAAQDVRELMAARNLHIIDVADVDGRGKARRAFGRVFYVEGHSLLFYAFDLGEIGSASKVLFQAWGQQEGMEGKPRNLGIFRIDDQSQRRWVLRVNDGNLLASIDSLFVTVEPSPGGNEPTGRRLIYAYLGTPANHP